MGYRLTTLAFDSASGTPVAASDSQTALSDIMTNPDETSAPGLFPPVGLAIDSNRPPVMTSDVTGEIYILQKSTATPTASASGTIVTATGSPQQRCWPLEPGIGAPRLWPCGRGRCDDGPVIS